MASPDLCFACCWKRGVLESVSTSRSRSSKARRGECDCRASGKRECTRRLPSPLYSGERGGGSGGLSSWPTGSFPLSPNPSPPSTGARGDDEASSSKLFFETNPNLFPIRRLQGFELLELRARLRLVSLPDQAGDP